jgi:hypothetical protein
MSIGASQLLHHCEAFLLRNDLAMVSSNVANGFLANVWVFLQCSIASQHEDSSL